MSPVRSVPSQTLRATVIQTPPGDNKIDAPLTSAFLNNPGGMFSGFISSTASAGELKACATNTRVIINHVAGDIFTFHFATEGTLRALARRTDVKSIQGSTQMQTERRA